MGIHAKNGKRYDLDLCIPAHNEAGTIIDAIRILSDLLTKSTITSWRIIIAENGSNDGTGSLVERANFPNVLCFRVNKAGKGRAIRESARISNAKVFGFIDADLSADPQHIPDFFEKVIMGEEVVIGSRLHRGANVVRGPFRTLSSRAFNVAARVMLGLNLNDTQCGLKLFNERACSILEDCVEDTWFLDLELLTRLKHKGILVREYPVNWVEYRFASRESKLRPVREMFRAMLAMWRIRKLLYK